MHVCPSKKKTKIRGLCTLTASPRPVKAPGSSLPSVCCRRFESKSLIDARLRMLRMFVPPLSRVKKHKTPLSVPIKMLSPSVSICSSNQPPPPAPDAVRIKTVKCTLRRWFLRGLLITIASHTHTHTHAHTHTHKKPFWCNKRGTMGADPQLLR